jgi:hypothetical protein
MIKRERVKNLLTNRLKILKDILISESYTPAQNTTGLFVAAIKKGVIPEGLSQEDSASAGFA